MSRRGPPGSTFASFPLWSRGRPINRVQRVRTVEPVESKVVSVPPHAENPTIQEMEAWGWSLASRQEVVGPLHYAPESAGRAMLRLAGEAGRRGAGTESGYGLARMAARRTVTYDHFVKLHFQRSWQAAGLDQKRELEREYNSLQPPAPPRQESNGALVAAWLFFFPLGIFWTVRRIMRQGSSQTFQQQAGAIAERRRQIWERARRPMMPTLEQSTSSAPASAPMRIAPTPAFRRLSCPRCKAVVTVAGNAKPKCQSCGFGA